MSREAVYREIMLNQLANLPEGFNWRVIALVKNVDDRGVLSVTDQTLNDGEIKLMISSSLAPKMQQFRPGMVIRIFGKKIDNGFEIHHVEPLDVDIEKYYLLRVLETRSSF